MARNRWMLWALALATLLFARGSEELSDHPISHASIEFASSLLPTAHPDTRPASLAISDADDNAQNVSPPSSPLQGQVDDCCDCTYQAVDDINVRVVHPTITELVKTAFFRFFKVNIHCQCPLWPDDGMCMLKACSVCVCDPSEVPQPWLAAEQKDCSARPSALGPPACDNVQCSAELDSRVDRNVDPQIHANLLNRKGWRGYNNPWMAEGEQDEDYLYINLLANPERYTGYSGEHAHRIWRAIYGQDCFTNIDSKEKVIFHRLISGMHASISAHLSAKYLLDEQRGLWGPNLFEFKARLGTPQVQGHVSNLYFSYLFVLQAVIKAGPLLERLSYDTGVQAEDERALELVRKLVHSRSIEASCPRPFDEGRLWQQGEASQQLKQQLQLAFQNITKIMDCVGCEKCKLWGKLQTLGVATALKILFSSPGDPQPQPPNASHPTPTPTPTPSHNHLHLERNEVIALLNLLDRFSSSIEYYRTLNIELQKQEVVSPVKPPSWFNVFSS